MNWNDITIKQFNEIEKLRGSLTEDMTIEDNIDINVKLISIIFNKDVDEVENLDIREMGELIKQTNFLREPIPNKRIENKYTINGRKYALNTNIQKLSVSQYIDFQTYKSNGENDIVKFLSIYLIPYGKTYGEYDFEEVYKDIESMSIVDGNAICFFFRLQFAILMRTSLIYSIKKMKRMMRKEKNKVKKEELKIAIKQLEKNLEEYGDGGIL